MGGQAVGGQPNEWMHGRVARQTCWPVCPVSAVLKSRRRCPPRMHVRCLRYLQGHLLPTCSSPRPRSHGVQVRTARLHPRLLTAGSSSGTRGVGESVQGFVQSGVGVLVLGSRGMGSIKRLVHHGAGQVGWARVWGGGV